MKAQWDEGSGRILLGDNTGGGAVMLQPIRFQCVGVCFSLGLFSVCMYRWPYIYSASPCKITPLMKCTNKISALKQVLSHKGRQIRHILSVWRLMMFYFTLTFPTSQRASFISIIIRCMEIICFFMKILGNESMNCAVATGSVAWCNSGYSVQLTLCCKRLST
jgi:quinol-cytochrome oxidoreductase complex cytochrome b subunit